MTLTGKAKEDFEKYTFGSHIEDIYLLRLDIFKERKLCVQQAQIIEWLDSVGIFIGLTYFKLGGGYFEWRIHYTRHFGQGDTRAEATTEAIKQANIIYNGRY